MKTDMPTLAAAVGKFIAVFSGRLSALPTPTEAPLHIGPAMLLLLPHAGSTAVAPKEVTAARVALQISLRSRSTRPRYPTTTPNDSVRSIAATPSALPERRGRRRKARAPRSRRRAGRAAPAPDRSS